MAFPLEFPHIFEGREKGDASNSYNFRMIIQKPSGEKNKYYPSIVKGSITYAYPFKIPIANTTIDTVIGGNTSAYLSPIRVDDIVRIQVNNKILVDESDVWINLF